MRRGTEMLSPSWYYARRQKFGARYTRSKRRGALEILRQHYQGKGKPRVMLLFTELTTLKKTDNESIVDYVIRAETALRNADEAVSDALLIAMVLKVLPSNFKNFK
jgi:hypothetical protein